MFSINRSKSYLRFYKFLQVIANPFLRLIYRVEIINEKNAYIKPKEGLIICCNHSSSLDPIIICAYFPRPIYFISKIELFRNKFLRSIMSFFNAFPIHRELSGKNVFKKSIEILNAGNVFGIFPEGTRSLSGEIGEIKKGIGLISYLANAPILPIAIFNSKKIPEDVHVKKKYLFLKIKIIYGELINTREIIAKYPQKEAVEIISIIVSNNIKELYDKLIQ